MLPDQGAWLSHYFFHAGGIYTEACDEVVLEAVEPFVRLCQARGWIGAWFFIRYTENGQHHVRLRVHGAPEVLERDVTPALRGHLAALFPGVVEGVPDGSSPLSAPGVTHHAAVPYEPETDRYGGPEGVRLAEALFHRSSEAALALLGRTRPGARSSRLGKALLAAVVLVHAFHESPAEGSDFLRTYETVYLRMLAGDGERRAAWLEAFTEGYQQQAGGLGAQVAECWRRLDAGDPLSPELDRYRDDVREIRTSFQGLHEAGRLASGGAPLRAWRDAVLAIVPSYLHMMNNRLGINLQEEAYVAHLVRRALDGRPAPTGA
jgi:thiopeptide-type bacteriocin biosynthesis protein